MKLSEVILRDTTANQPDATDVPEGTLFFDTDLDQMQRSNGTVWEIVEATALSNPMTTAGDIIVGGASGTPNRLGVGSDGEVLTLVAGTPSWEAATGGSGLAQSGAIASRPAAGTAGLIYVPTDDPAIGVDSGSLWNEWGAIAKLSRPKPQNLLAGLSWVNQGGATAVENDNGLLLTAPVSSAGSRMLVKSAPATPWTLTVAFIPAITHTAPFFGLVGRQSSDGKFVSLFYQNGNACGGKFTSPTVFSAFYFATATCWAGPLIFMRLTDNGTNRLTYFSADGINWVLWHTVGRTDFCTVDQIGIVLDVNSATPHFVLLVHWAVT